MRHTTAAVDGLPSILDVPAFRKRLEEIEASGTLADPYREFVHTFLDAWTKQDQENNFKHRQQLPQANGENE